MWGPADPDYFGVLVDEPFDIAPETTVASSDQPLPHYLTDPQKLAKAVWEFWINTLHSDGVPQDLPIWSELDNEEVSHLVESLQVNVTEPLKKIIALRDSRNKTELESLKKEITRLSTAPRQETKVVYGCYACGKMPVDRPAGICERCNP